MTVVELRRFGEARTARRAATAARPGWRSRFSRHAFAGAVVALDVVCLAVVPPLIFPAARSWALPVFAVLTLALLLWGGQYRPRITPGVAGDLGVVVGGVGLTLLVVALVGGFGANPVHEFVDVWALSAVSALCARFLLYSLARMLWGRGWFAESTLVIGAGQIAVQLTDLLMAHPEFGLKPVGFLDDVEGPQTSRLPLPLLGGVADLATVLKVQGVRQVIVAFGRTREDRLVEVVRACEDASVEIRVVPRFFELGFAARHRNVDVVWGFPLIRLPRAVLRAYPRYMKRAFDAVVASILLVLVSPAYGLMAVGVKCTSRGPVYFKQRRVGQRGQVVEILKFRSMRVNKDSDTQWNVEADSRVTRLGRLMRDTSLDELPQLWNVVRGDMSLVGPRPERPHFAQHFGATVRHYDHRHRVPVGLTGLAQVHGLRGNTSIGERARLDNQYIETWSMGQDLVILGKTATAIVRHATSSLVRSRHVEEVANLDGGEDLRSPLRIGSDSVALVEETSPAAGSS